MKSASKVMAAVLCVVFLPVIVLGFLWECFADAFGCGRQMYEDAGRWLWGP